ncbi:MAG: aminoacetone oxidase family FAD-binding enzyme [Olsenella sp.]|nr:aminoacetone oxidase family FAD-binding enzyme [Olsenella sp.]
MTANAHKRKTQSRAQRREALLDAASSVEVAASYDVVVIGGGAAGLTAAICAGEKNARTLVLESSRECGRSILATGNGRCNFSNVGLAEKYYNDPEFVGAVFGNDPLKDVLGFFRQCDMRWCLEEERLYPLSKRAASVRNVLLRRARNAGVTLAPARSVTSVRREGDGYAVAFADGFGNGSSHEVSARSVVLAAGGTQSDGKLDVARDLGLRTVPTSGVLCPVGMEPNPMLELDGRRLTARVQLTHTRFPIWSERGEVLVRPYGLSGIVIFNMSRHVEPGDLVELDLLPDLTASELQQMVDPFFKGTFESGCLDGVLDPDLAAILEGLARSRWSLDGNGTADATTDSKALVALAKSYPLRATGTTEVAQAQVLRGGLANDQFSPQTLECLSSPGFFVAGEALDVDGECGGFNLSWAWKSGMVAGTSAATR